MEILTLKTFKAVVDEQGIKGAADKLNTVQSNITNRIKKLETELDTKLFTLTGRKLQLTPSGQQLYEYAEQILQLEYQAISAMSRNKNTYELRVGMPETFAAVHMPLALKQLKLNHAEIRTKIHTDTSERLVFSVLNNKVDCAAIGNAPKHENLVVIPIVKEELIMVTPRDSEYDPVLLVRDEGCGYRQHAMLWRQQAGRGSDELMVMSSADGVLGCIAAGLGYTIIGKNMVAGSRYEKSLLMKPVSHGPKHVQLSIVYRKGCPLESGILTLATLLTK
ncbi:LysR family transcriptional regulator [Shewanella ulleungensis]|uniref:LysR family transcriptional regulator n=1 Tax=Shewanella ulleungensis TaxID=2282699 RepID=A0ABQ2QCM4_9GAMM|nr:LysR family transcriptional regulator [Shewanella ulleungensis]MCL1149224.1 LysR family transcriptional regulator [Shewanella ulleungensis]GGP72769.1 LysR family transcriptional regulator [Shewanella ulleungensis]